MAGSREANGTALATAIAAAALAAAALAAAALATPAHSLSNKKYPILRMVQDYLWYKIKKYIRNLRIARSNGQGTRSLSRSHSTWVHRVYILCIAMIRLLIRPFLDVRQCDYASCEAASWGGVAVGTSGPVLAPGSPWLPAPSQHCPERAGCSEEGGGSVKLVSTEDVA